MKTIPADANTNFRKWEFYEKLEHDEEWLRIERDETLDKFFTTDDNLHVWYRGHHVLRVSYKPKSDILIVKGSCSLHGKPDHCAGTTFKLPGTNTTIERIKQKIDRFEAYTHHWIIG